MTDNTSSPAANHGDDLPYDYDIPEGFAEGDMPTGRSGPAPRRPYVIVAVHSITPDADDPA
jgi:hypothetical protein